MKLTHVLYTILVLTAATLGLGTKANASSAAQNNEFTPDLKLRYAMRIVEQFYADPIDSATMDHMVQDAIVAILKNVDPHSTYSDPQETADLTMPLDGNFSGVGIQFNMLNDTLFVIQTTVGGPCQRVGILPGDRILQANDSILSGVKRPNSDILKILRGPKGTNVDMTVLRRGEPQPLHFSVTRDDIPVYSVETSFMANDSTGYVRVIRFARETGDELFQALRNLRQQGMKNLIVDLSSNGGGYLEAAVESVNLFVPQGTPIVSTESPRTPPTQHIARNKGIMTDGRLVIIVNENSASASEIMAGAIQDNDRGLVVGRRTFGKGLVQRPFPFPDGSMIRLTVSRYHTPSGRCIQRPYSNGDPDAYRNDMEQRYKHGEHLSADSIHLNDSLRYETLLNHRTVYGGGGIMPDLFVPVDTTGYSTYYRDLVAHGILNSYAITYVDNHRDQLRHDYPTPQSYIDNFTVTDTMIDALVNMAQERNVSPDPQGLERSLNDIKIILKGYIGRDLHDVSTYYKAVYPIINNEYIEALNLINDPQRYNSILRADSPIDQPQ